MANASPSGDELRPEYDESVFENAERGKYARRYADGTNIVRLAPDVAAAFPDEKAVNDALRFVMRVADDAGRLTGRST
ncbi:MAG: hypothetical protein HQ567_32120 [Candidatus Nealsonbacteria bacterium]|nr:hypothetical protein [Candidatus Nealsonbacteria bacterium]